MSERTEAGMAEYGLMGRVVRDRGAWLLALSVMLAYLLIYQLAVQDLTLDGAARPFGFFVVANWEGLMWRERAPFQFEPIAVAEAPHLVWLISPVNLAIGSAMGALTGMQIGLARVARRCSAVCGLSPATGVLAGLPGLLAGSACCAPVIFILLGVQVTASLISVMSLMIPIAFVLLAAGLVATTVVAARRCAAAAAGGSGIRA